MFLSFVDLPSILSGKCLNYLDPQERYLPIGKERGKRKRIEYTSARELNLEDHKDRMQRTWLQQMEPYQLSEFGDHQQFLQESDYKGTLFRFPLRNEAMESELCDTIYTPQKVLTLFDSLKVDGHLVLLFLNHLEKIRVLHRKKGQCEPETILEINIAKHCLPSVREVRKQVIENVRSNKSTGAVYPVDIETSTNGQECRQHHLLMCQYYKPEVAGTPLVSNLNYLPWVGMAIPWGPSIHREVTRPEGHIFCFLPLPLEERSPTGLHCHVNGYFAVDQNRRHIKWLSADQDLRDVTDEALRWNMYLVENLLPGALTELMISSVAKLMEYKDMDNSTIWELMQVMIPDPQQVTPQWQSLVDPVYRLLINAPIFYTEANGGQWLRWDEAVFDDQLQEQNDLSETLHEVLIRGRMPLVKIQHHILEAFEHYCHQQGQRITPALLHSTLLKTQLTLTLTSSQRLQLLGYLAKDRNWAHLSGLKLLPLASKDFVEFSMDGGYATEIYIDSQEHKRSFFPGLTHMFLDREELDPKTLKDMEDLARQGSSLLILVSEHGIKIMLIYCA